jgi:RimJ/RimL family protein N-acetyltransferase
MLVFGEDELLAEWLGRQLGLRFSPPYVCIGVVRDDQLVAVALYNNYEPPNIQMTFATTTPRWATRQMIGRLLAYPFRELGCLRVSVVTRDTNRPTRAFLCRLGFRQEGFHPSMFGENDDGVSYGLMRNDAQKWLEESHESPEHARAAESRNDGGRTDQAKHPDGAG